MSTSKVLKSNALFFLCDVQTRFKDAIYGFDEVVLTANRMLKIAKICNNVNSQILGCEVVVSEQNPKALGNTVPEIDLFPLGPLHLGTFPKTVFSMVIPEVKAILLRKPHSHIVLFGIESHVCVLQTALDLIDLGHTVHVLADGVSSCNKEEVPFALSRIRQAGGNITTSESAAFQLMRDSSKPNFKAFASLIKEEKDTTKNTVEKLLQSRSAL